MGKFRTIHWQRLRIDNTVFTDAFIVAFTKCHVHFGSVPIVARPTCSFERARAFAHSSHVKLHFKLLLIIVGATWKSLLACGVRRGQNRQRTALTWTVIDRFKVDESEWESQNVLWEIFNRCLRALAPWQWWSAPWSDRNEQRTKPIITVLWCWLKLPYREIGFSQSLPPHVCLAGALVCTSASAATKFNEFDAQRHTGNAILFDTDYLFCSTSEMVERRP